MELQGPQRGAWGGPTSDKAMYSWFELVNMGIKGGGRGGVKNFVLGKSHEVCIIDYVP